MGFHHLSPRKIERFERWPFRSFRANWRFVYHCKAEAIKCWWRSCASPKASSGPPNLGVMSLAFHQVLRPFWDLSDLSPIWSEWGLSKDSTLHKERCQATSSAKHTDFSAKLPKGPRDTEQIRARRAGRDSEPCDDLLYFHCEDVFTTNDDHVLPSPPKSDILVIPIVGHRKNGENQTGKSRENLGKWGFCPILVVLSYVLSMLSIKNWAKNNIL